MARRNEENLEKDVLFTRYLFQKGKEDATTRWPEKLKAGMESIAVAAEKAHDCDK